MMKAATLRNFPPELVRIIRRKARQERVSINKAVISLLEKNVPISSRKKSKLLHHELDCLAGSWTKKEAVAFEKALALQRTVDLDW